VFSSAGNKVPQGVRGDVPRTETTVTEPGGDKHRHDEDDGLSPLASAYQKAGPYLAASTNLVAAVGIFTYAGYWADQKLGLGGPWLTLTGALVGMVGGFVSFFKIVMALDKRDKQDRTDRTDTK